MMMTAAQLAEHYKVHVATIGRAIEKYNLRASEEARMPKARGAMYDDVQVAEIGKHITRLQVAPQPKAQAKKKIVQRAAQVKTQLAQVDGANALQVAAQGELQVATQEVRKLQEEVAQLKTQLAEQVQLNERIARRLKVLTDGLTRHHKAIGVLGTQVETHGALIVNLHYSLPHYPGSTDPRLRAIKIAQEQAARNAPPDAIDEGGQETLEKLATLDAENEAWLAPDGGMAKAVERQAEERAKSA